MTLVTAPIFLVAPIIATQRLGGAGAYGAIFTALGLGSIAGAIGSAKVRPARPGIVACAGVATISGAAASLALLPLPGILVFFVITGVGVTLFQVIWTTAVQRDVPDALVGRVLALDLLANFGMMPIGYAVAGAVVGAIAPRSILLVGAVIALLSAPLPLLTAEGRMFRSSRSVSGPVDR